MKQAYSDTSSKTTGRAAANSAASKSEGTKAVSPFKDKRPASGGPQINGKSVLSLKQAFSTPTEDKGSQAVVQRVLDFSAVRTELTGTEEMKKQYARFVTPLGKKINTYNTLFNPKAKSENLHPLFSLLDAIEREANALLQLDHLPKTARAAIFAVLDQAEKDHVVLTKQSLALKHPLWMPEGVSKEDNAKSQNLWRSLTGQSKRKGNLRVQSDDEEFKARTYSGFSRLLTGDHGRGLLEELNFGGHKSREKRTVISDNLGKHFPHLSNKLDATGSYSQPLADTENKGDKHSLQPGDVSNTGTGSYVQIDRKTPTDPLDYEKSDTGRQLHVPEYIDLAHELGHSRHHLRGETKSTFTDQTKLNSILWTNPEEKENIQHEENPIRDEHGLARRKYHKGHQSEQTERLRFPLKAEFERIMGLFPDHFQSTRLFNAQVRNLGAISTAINAPVITKPQATQLRTTLRTLNTEVVNFVRQRQQQQAPQQAQQGGGGWFSWLWG